METLLALLEKTPQPIWDAIYHVFLDMARTLVSGGSFQDAVKAAENSALALDKIQAVYDTRAAAKFPGFVPGPVKGDDK